MQRYRIRIDFSMDGRSSSFSSSSFFPFFFKGFYIYLKICRFYCASFDKLWHAACLFSLPCNKSFSLAFSVFFLFFSHTLLTHSRSLFSLHSFVETNTPWQQKVLRIINTSLLSFFSSPSSSSSSSSSSFFFS